MNTIGIIAGSGRFPFILADQIRKTGDRVVTVALKEETSPDLESSVDAMHWVSLGQYQKLIDIFKKEGVSTVLMAGRVRHASIFSVLNLDLRAVKLLASLTNKKTDTILRGIADDLEKDGIRLVSPQQYLSGLIPSPGILSGPALSKAEKADVEFGYGIAKQIAGLDIGQTIAVKDKAVVAVEAMEGTNDCIRRAGRIAGRGAILIKVAKPGQDWRFDLPVIGTTTFELLKEAGFRALAVDSGITLFLDREQSLSTAKAGGITIMAL